MLYHIYFPKLPWGSATGGRLSQVERDLAAVGSLLLPNTDVQQKEGGIAIVCVYLCIYCQVSEVPREITTGECSFNLGSCCLHASIHRSKQTPVIIDFQVSCSSYPSRQVRTRTTYHMQGRIQEYRPIRTCK